MLRRDVFERIRQTRTARIVVVYAATAWGIFEIVDKIVRTFGWPEAIPRSFLILLVVGLGIVTIAAWAYAGQEIGDRTGWTWPARVQALLTHRWFGRVAVAGLAAAVLLWGWRMLRPEVGYEPFSVPELRASSRPPRLAILPVSSGESGLDLQRRTLTRLLTVDLNDVGDLRTIRGERVTEEWRDEVLIEPREAARLGRRLDAHFVVVPGMERGGEGLRVTAEILEAGRGESIGHVVAEGRAGDLADLSDRLAMDVYRALVADDGDETLADPARARTRSMRAYKAFLRAERSFRRADFAGALAEYGLATEADSSFAMAWFRQGLARRWEDPSVGPPIESFDNAMTNVERLSEDDREMWRASGALEWGMLESVSAMAAVVARRPTDAQARYLLADAQSWVGPALLLAPDSVSATLDRAVAADPGFVPTQLLRIPIRLLRGAGREEAEALVDSLEAADALPAVVARQRLLVDLAFGEDDRSAELGHPHPPAVVDGGRARDTPLPRSPGPCPRRDPQAGRRGRPPGRQARALLQPAGPRRECGRLALLDGPEMSGFLPEAVYRTLQRGEGLPTVLVLAATDVLDPYGGSTTWFYGGALAVDHGAVGRGDIRYAFDRLMEESRLVGQDGEGYAARERSMVAALLDQYAEPSTPPPAGGWPSCGSSWGTRNGRRSTSARCGGIRPPPNGSASSRCGGSRPGRVWPAAPRNRIILHDLGLCRA